MEQTHPVRRAFATGALAVAMTLLSACDEPRPEAEPGVTAKAPASAAPLDHEVGQQRRVGAVKAAAGERRIQHVPVGRVAQAEAQVLDHGAGAGTAERARVQHVVIAPGTAVARGVLERVRHGGAQVAGLGGAAVVTMYAKAGLS